jgi:hypothetical protein
LTTSFKQVNLVEFRVWTDEVPEVWHVPRPKSVWVVVKP